MAPSITAAAQAGSHGVLLHIDLDRFKKVNDTFGHHIGDRVLRDASALIESVVTEMDVTATHMNRGQWSRILVGRVGGNGFSVMIGGLEPADAIQRAVLLSQRLQGAFRQPFRTRDQDLYITLSTGIALFPEDGQDAEQLMANAEKAMYQAKRRGRNNYEFFSEEVHSHAIGNLKLTPADLALIDSVLRLRQGPDGDTFTLERDRTGRHGSIMKYNLNRQAS